MPSMIRKSWSAALGLLAVFAAGAALAATGAQERYAKEYLDVAVRGNAEGMLNFYHPGELDDLRARVLRKLEEEAMAGRKIVRSQAFGPVSTLEDIRRMTPNNLFLNLAQKVGLPSQPVEEIKVLGAVEENSQLTHVLARLSPTKDAKNPSKDAGRSQLAIVSLIKYGKDWRVALPISFQARVDALLAEQTTQSAPATGAAAAGTRDPGILKLIETSTAELRAGDCAAYFNEQMSPNFRKATSDKALKTLITQCQKSEDARETYIAALEVAKRLTPTFENNGARAIYDMRGQGLPFTRYALEKVGDRWFIAE